MRDNHKACCRNCGQPLTTRKQIERGHCRRRKCRELPDALHLTERRRPPEGTASNTTGRVDAPKFSGSSSQVSWWSVHEYVSGLLAAVGTWPMIGTPQWCALPDDDLAKIASIFDAAQHHALRVETSQEAQCEASRGVSAAADWRDIAQQMFRLNCAKAYGSYYIPRVKL